MDVMQRRRQLMTMDTGGLPGAYRAVEYIENSGTQYIATDYVPTIDETEVRIAFWSNAPSSGNDLIFGSANGYTTRYFMQLYNLNTWYCAIGLTRYSNVINKGINGRANKLITRMTKEQMTTIDVASGATNSLTPNTKYSKYDLVLPVYIFALNNNGVAQDINRSLRIYGLQFYRSGLLTADFVPCIRKSDSKPGLYDTVSKTFYTNAGAGEFIVPA